MIRQSDTLKAFSILFGFILLWLVLELSARLLGSFRGEYGHRCCYTARGIAENFDAVTRSGYRSGLEITCRRSIPQRADIDIAVAEQIVLAKLHPPTAKDQEMKQIMLSAGAN